MYVMVVFSARFADAPDVHRMVCHLEIEFLGDLFLSFFDYIILKLDEFAALGTNEMIMVFLEPKLIFFSFGAERERIDDTGIFEESKRTVDRRDTNGEVRMLTSDKAIEIFRGKVPFIVIECFKHQFPLLGKFQRILFE